LRDLLPLRYVTVTAFPGSNPEPWATTSALFFPEDGVKAICGTGGAGDTGVVTGVTVSTAVPESKELGSVALIVVAPSATPVASPWEPGMFETVALLVNDEDHVTESVRF
jgi:hypothetical protein